MSDKFFDASMNKMKPGQILAQYRAVAYAADGDDKERLIEILTDHSAEAAIRFANKVLKASERSAVDLCLAISRDLNAGIPKQDIVKKHYKYTLEALFYVDPENMPVDDPHWSIIPLITREEFEDKTGIKAED